MSDDLSFYSSRFARWCAQHESLIGTKTDALKDEALALLVESVKAGEIVSLDGVDTPLSKKIMAHHRPVDFEMNSNWIGSSQAWVCPCCSRSKFQISRIGRKNQILAKLVIHHDHMGEALKAAFHLSFEEAGTDIEQIDGQRLIERIGKAFAAYEEVLVCEDCNNADTEAKKLVAAPPHFSFSIGQIRRFICNGDHHPHKIDALAAHQAWQEARPAYELRMKLIRAVAHAAATDSHWYEPYDRRMAPVPVLGHSSSRSEDFLVQRWVSIGALYEALGPKKMPSSRNLSRWRLSAAKVGRALPGNFLAMLRSDETCASTWDSVSEAWHCPICQRSKQQVVYVGDGGRVKFYLSSNAGRGSWSSARCICNHCNSVLMRLKLEVAEAIGETPYDSYGFVSPDELAQIIVSRPHSSHLIRSKEAEALLALALERLS